MGIAAAVALSTIAPASCSYVGCKLPGSALVRTETKSAAIKEARAVAADVHPHAEDESAASLLDDETAQNDPCRYLGCNSYKCAWVSGEVVAKVAPKKACHNAKIIGSATGEADGMPKIE